MTDSGTDIAALTWAVPECPFPIESSARVLDDIRLAVTDAFFSLPRGGAEIGGILLGKFENGRLSIHNYAALDCEHAYGPSFTLSPPDQARLAELLAAHANHAGGLRPVGWYHSHTRSEIFLSDADLQIHNRFFPEPWQVALVMKPHTFQPARIGFFVRRADGTLRADASYREETLVPLPIRQVPNGSPHGAATADGAAPQDNDPPHRRFRPAPAAEEPAIESIAAPVAPNAAGPDPAAPMPEPAPGLALPKFAVQSASASRRWMFWGVGLVAALGILAAAFEVRDLWLPRVLAAIRMAPDPTAQPAAPPLGLNTIDRDGQLQIAWDRTSPALRHSTDAILEITDGGPLPVAIQLDRAHLEAGSFTYARTSEKVDILLIVHQKEGPDFREITSFLGKLPERKSDDALEAERARREEIAREAAKLKADMTSQAAKTKKLEKEVESMREELRQQQQRRLNNQVPDKQPK